MLKIIRLGEVTPAQLARELGQEETEIKKALSGLVEKGYLKLDRTYKVAFGRKRGAKLPMSIWESLEKKL